MEFNPDDLVIEKSDLFTVIDALIIRWKKNYIKNAVVIGGAHAFKLGIKAIEDNKFAELWHEMVNFTNELIAFNEMKRLKGEFPKTEDFVNLFCSKITEKADSITLEEEDTRKQIARLEKEVEIREKKLDKLYVKKVREDLKK